LRVQGSGFKVQGSGVFFGGGGEEHTGFWFRFRVSGSGSLVLGFGFRVSSFGFREDLERLDVVVEERIVIELMTPDRKLKDVQRGLEMKDLRDLKDLTIHDV